MATKQYRSPDAPPATAPAKVIRQFAAEVQYLKGGKYWTHLRTVVIQASNVVSATAKAARLGKSLLPKGTRNPGLLVKVTPATSLKLEPTASTPEAK